MMLKLENDRLKEENHAIKQRAKEEVMRADKEAKEKVEANARKWSTELKNSEERAKIE